MGVRPGSEVGRRLILAGFAFPPLLLLGADSTGGNDQLPPLPAPVQYGLLGILILALASGRFLIPRYAYERERARADQLEDEVRRLNQVLVDRFVPSLEAATHAVTEAQRVISDQQRVIRGQQGQ